MVSNSFKKSSLCVLTALFNAVAKFLSSSLKSLIKTSKSPSSSELKSFEKINLKTTLEEYNNLTIRYEEAKRTNKNCFHYYR